MSISSFIQKAMLCEFCAVINCIFTAIVHSTLVVSCSALCYAVCSNYIRHSPTTTSDTIYWKF